MGKKYTLLSIYFLVGFFNFLSTCYSKDFKGAEYRTKESYLYGRFEVRMKSAQKDGVLSTFFTYFDGLPDDPWAMGKWNEIDIEILGRYTNDVQFNPITPNQINHVSHVWTDFNPGDDFHTYAFEWTPDYVSWFIDGVEVRKQTADHIKTLTRAQKIMLNTWIPQWANWAGDWNQDALPAFTFYDYVSYSSFTPGSGSNGTSNNFTSQWKDDFDSLNTERWEKATHTFSGNLVDFEPQNIVFSDGNLILCLTDKTNFGYKDNFGPKVLYTRQSDTLISVQFSEIVDKASAEKTSNFLIPNLTVKRARLTGNQSIVELVTSKPDSLKSYSIFVQKIYDLSKPPNISALVSKSISKAKKLSFPLKIDVGSLNANLDYSADQQITFDKMYGAYDGEYFSTSNPISSTASEIVYQTDNRGICQYKVRVPNGTYKLTLEFSENQFSEPGTRVTDITAENSANKKFMVDVFNVAGVNSAFQTSFNSVKVEDGELDLHFSSVSGVPSLAGLIVEQLSVSTEMQRENRVNQIHFNLHQNYPNPFNGETVIEFDLQKPQNILFDVYDVAGKIVSRKDLGYLAAKKHLVRWEAKDNSGNMLSSGTYFFSITGQQSRESKKLTIVK